MFGLLGKAGGGGGFGALVAKAKHEEAADCDDIFEFVYPDGHKQSHRVCDLPTKGKSSFQLLLAHLLTGTDQTTILRPYIDNAASHDPNTRRVDCSATWMHMVESWRTTSHRIRRQKMHEIVDQLVDNIDHGDAVHAADGL